VYFLDISIFQIFLTQPESDLLHESQCQCPKMLLKIIKNAINLGLIFCLILIKMINYLYYKPFLEIFSDK
jgi:hypothetical protein